MLKHLTYNQNAHAFEILLAELALYLPPLFMTPSAAGFIPPARHHMSYGDGERRWEVGTRGALFGHYWPRLEIRL